ncbi:hypothetical protein [Winslowiella iniecta]|uniref:Uncharacterized protein n=1 Tax=Winslowiella iniecta TaxID=1560201 RepID=A0A0L7T7T7_9GAMM|nr:hypothetical protein [Winslowiella iniecta]KOC91424.1 hypothetical protein NG43_15420 [Winslowiella iniecta]KOC92115.1 hypothetical protein NG42_02605 [Winslowiella iniecta]
MTAPDNFNSPDAVNIFIDNVAKKANDCLEKAKLHGVDAAERTFYKQTLLLLATAALSIPSVLVAVFTNGIFGKISMGVNLVWVCSAGADAWCAWRNWSAKARGEKGWPMDADMFGNILFYSATKYGYSETSSQSIAIVGSNIYRFIRATVTVLSGRIVPFDTPKNLKIWHEVCSDVKVAIEFVLSLAEASANISSVKSVKNAESAHANLLEVTRLLKERVDSLETAGTAQLEIVIEIMIHYLNKLQAIVDCLPQKKAVRPVAIEADQATTSSV